MRFLHSKPCLPIGLFSFLLVSCQTLYDPGELDAGKYIPVITGILTDQQVPVKVSMATAAEFNTNYYSPIRGALVTIRDNEGNSVILGETRNGLYESDTSLFQTRTGNFYILEAELTDGTRIESDPVLLNPYNNRQDSIFARVEKQIQYSHSFSGSLLETEVSGIQLMVNLKTNSETPQYFRFYSNVVVQKLYYRDPNSPLPIPVYCWDQFVLTGNPDVAASYPENGAQRVPDHPMGFLPYVSYPYIPSDTAGPTLGMGWIVTTKVSVISPQSYQFYSKVKKQLEAGEKIFDPIPSQIIGNIKCTSHPDRPVMGIFEACTERTFIHAFYYVRGMKTYRMKTLQELHLPSRANCVDSLPPDFWVMF